MNQRKCKKCGADIETGRTCLECKKKTYQAASKKYYESNKEKIKSWQKAYVQKLKDTGRYTALLEKHRVAAKRYWERKKAKSLIDSGKLNTMIDNKYKKIAALEVELKNLLEYKEKWYKEFNISL